MTLAALGSGTVFLPMLMLMVGGRGDGGDEPSGPGHAHSHYLSRNEGTKYSSYLDGPGLGARSLPLSQNQMGPLLISPPTDAKMLLCVLTKRGTCSTKGRRRQL